MRTLIPVTEPPANHTIARSLGPGYQSHWRFQVSQQYLIRIAQAKDHSVALSEVLSAEKDPFVRQLVLFESGRASVIAAPVEYALRCHRSQHENAFARMISAMVVAGRSSSQIADELGTTPIFIIAFEKIFFDVRRYREQRFWLKQLCYFPGRVTGLGEDASRPLITAFERGWNGLAGSFSLFRREPVSRHDPNPAGKWVVNQLLLGVTARQGDFVSTLEMKGVTPSLAELEFLQKIAFFAQELSPTLSQLDYPAALSPKEEKERREVDELVGRMSPIGRRKVANFFERLTYQANISQADQDKASGSS